MDAPSEAHVRQSLVSRGYSVNVVIPTAPPKPQPQPRSAAMNPQFAVGPTSRASAPPQEFAVFFRSLASYLPAGVAIHQALVEIASKSPSRGMRYICERMALRVRGGERLSAAMTEFPRAFPLHVVGVVNAGEIGGFLPVMVSDIALDYEIAQRASNRWMQWGCKLAWINAIGTVLVAPLLPMMFAPGVTDFYSALVKYVRFTSVYIALPMALLIAMYYVARSILRQPSMRPVTDAVVLRIPGSISRASRMRSLASFSRILWRLQQAGILPIQAWDAASRSAENTAVASRLHQQVESVRSGRKFSDALAATGMFSSEDERVLAVGESTGQTADMLQRIALYYEDGALAAVGRTKWIGLRIVILANIIAIGVAIYCAEVQTTMNMFNWVDSFFKTDTGP